MVCSLLWHWMPSTALPAAAVAVPASCAAPGIGTLWVPKTSSTSCDQAIFVDQATGASVSSDAVLLEIDRFG